MYNNQNSEYVDPENFQIWFYFELALLIEIFWQKKRTEK